MLKKNLIKYAKNHDIKINQTLKKQQIINKLSDKSNDIDVKKLDFSKLKKQELLNFAKSQSIKINPALKKDAILTMIGKSLKVNHSAIIDYAKTHKINLHKCVKKDVFTKNKDIKQFLNDSSLYLQDLKTSNLLSYAMRYNSTTPVLSSKKKLIQLIKRKNECSYVLNKPYCQNPEYGPEDGILFVSLLYVYYKRKNNYNFVLNNHRIDDTLTQTDNLVGISIYHYEPESKNFKASFKSLQKGESFLYQQGGIYKLHSGSVIVHDYFFNENDIQNFKKSKKRFLIIPLYLEKERTKHEAHSNVMIYDSKTKILEYFEPHGSTVGFFDKSITASLIGVILSKSLIKLKLDIQSVVSAYPFNMRGIQHYNTHEPKFKDERGFCSRWCDWFVDYRLKHENESVQQLTMNAFKNIYKTRTFIRNYTNFLKTLANRYVPDCMGNPTTLKILNCQRNKKELLKQLT